jgi:hypothetical protein
MNFHIESADLAKQFCDIIKKHNFFFKDAASSFVPTLSNGHMDIRFSVDRTVVEVFLVVGKEYAELEHLFIFLYPDKNLNDEKRLVMKGIQIGNFISYQIRCYAELIQQWLPFILDPTWEIPIQYINKKKMYKNVHDLIMTKYFHILDLRYASSSTHIDLEIRNLQKKGIDIPIDILEVLDNFELSVDPADPTLN